MSISLATPTSASAFLTQVVHLYLAVADTVSRTHDPNERQVAIDLAHRWAPNDCAENIEAVVDTAYVAARFGLDVERIASELRKTLSYDDCVRLLADLGRIAQADGHLTVREAQVIARIRAVLG